MSQRVWAAVVVGAGLLLSACSTEQPDLPTDPSPPAASVTAAQSSTSESVVSSAPSSTMVSSSSEPSTPSTTAPSEPVDQEAADRAAIEQAWTGYWDANEKLAAVPVNDRPARLEPYAVDPILTMALDKAEELSAQGQIGYGAPISKITWPGPVAGADTVDFEDCSDSSKLGIQNATTGELITRGPDVELIKVTAVRGADSIWRISRIQYMVNQECER